MLELVKKRKSVLGNEKGLTLVELLAVIVILAIIAAIAIPSIGGIINNTKTKAHDANAQIIIDAARFKVVTAQPADSTTTYSMKLLADEGYLEEIPLDPDVKGQKYDEDDSKVTITRDASGKYSYQATLAHSDGTVVAGFPKTEDTLKGVPAPTPS